MNRKVLFLNLLFVLLAGIRTSAQITVSAPVKITRTIPVAGSTFGFISTTTSATGSSNNLLYNVSSTGGTLLVASYTVNSVTTPAGSTYTIANTGDITVNADGSYSFTPVTGYANLVPPVTINITDGTNSSSTRTLGIAVTSEPGGGGNLTQLNTGSMGFSEDQPAFVPYIPPIGSPSSFYLYFPGNTPAASMNGVYTLNIYTGTNAGGYVSGLGTFTAASTPDVTVSGSGTGNITLTGTVDALNNFMVDSSLRPVYRQSAPDINRTCQPPFNYTSKLYLGTVQQDMQQRVITIIPVNDALNYFVNACQDANKSLNVLTGTGTISGLPNNFEANTANPPQPVTVTAINGAAIVNPIATTNGSITVNSNGSVVYTPNTGYTGIDSFTYTAQPGAGCPETRKVTLTVGALPATPTANATQPGCTNPNGSITVTAPTGSGFTYSIDSINYQAGTSFNNVAAGTYPVSVRNSNGCISPVTQVILTAPDCAPAALNDTASTPVNTSLNATVTANDTCRTAPCTYSALASAPPAHGTVTVNADGTYTYTPNTGFTGTDTFSYVVCNSAAPTSLCDTARVFIAVASPLPANLVLFQAEAGPDCTVQLSWATGVEQNLHHFEVESGTDGLGFTPAGSVMAKGSGSSYTYVYQNGVKGPNYFRLRLQDLDGAYSYSRVVPIRLGCAPERRIRVYPTLVKDQLTIDGLQQGEQITVYDIKGSRILQAKAGGPVAGLDLSRMSNGSYWVVVLPLTGDPVRYRIVKQ